MPDDAGCRVAARAPCCPSPDQRSATSHGSAQRDAPALAVMRELAGPVSALWLPEDSDLSRAPGPPDECGTGLSTVAPGRPASTATSAAAAGGLAAPATAVPPTARNHVWAYDFVFDTCADGRSLKCLTIVDEFTRECLAIDVAGSIRSGRVIDLLGHLVSLHGAPRYLRSDNGPEFVATALLRWLHTADIDTAFIDPGKPWQNGTDESFNGKFRNECLSLEWFRNRMEAKIGIERWRRHYNEERPHMSLGDLTPAEFKKQMGTTHGWLGESLTGVILQ